MPGLNLNKVLFSNDAPQTTATGFKNGFVQNNFILATTHPDRGDKTSSRSPHTQSGGNKRKDSTFDDRENKSEEQFAARELFENAELKLTNLATQLGESCLTNDLAALIS